MSLSVFNLKEEASLYKLESVLVKDVGLQHFIFHKLQSHNQSEDFNSKKITELTQAFTKILHSHKAAIPFVQHMVKDRAHSLGFAGKGEFADSSDILVRMMSELCIIDSPRDFLSGYILPLAEKLHSGKSFEIDPMRCSNKMTKKNVKSLKKNVGNLLKELSAGVPHIPQTIKVVVSLLQEAVEGEDQEIKNRVLGNFFFLHYFCRSFINPEGYGISVPREPNVRRGLLLVAKVLQSIACGTPLDKEPYMNVLSDFVADHASKMDAFWDSMMKSLKDSCPNQAVKRWTRREILLVYGFIVSEFDDLKSQHQNGSVHLIDDPSSILFISELIESGDISKDEEKRIKDAVATFGKVRGKSELNLFQNFIFPDKSVKREKSLEFGESTVIEEEEEGERGKSKKKDKSTTHKHPLGDTDKEGLEVPREDNRKSHSSGQLKSSQDSSSLHGFAHSRKKRSMTSLDNLPFISSGRVTISAGKPKVNIWKKNTHNIKLIETNAKKLKNDRAAREKEKFRNVIERKHDDSDKDTKNKKDESDGETKPHERVNKKGSLREKGFNFKKSTDKSEDKPKKDDKQHVDDHHETPTTPREEGSKEEEWKKQHSRAASDVHCERQRTTSFDSLTKFTLSPDSADEELDSWEKERATSVIVYDRKRPRRSSVAYFTTPEKEKPAVKTKSKSKSVRKPRLMKGDEAFSDTSEDDLMEEKSIIRRYRPKNRFRHPSSMKKQKMKKIARRPTLKKKSSSPPIILEYKFPVFNTTLDEIMQHQKKRYPFRQLPLVLTYLCDSILKLSGEKQEGIFRKSADFIDEQELQKALDNADYDCMQQKEDPHIAASTLKKWLQSLSSPLIPETLYVQCLDSVKEPDDHIILTNLIIDLLPDINRKVLCFLLNFLNNHILCSDSQLTNKMTPHNISTVFAPCILKPPETDITELVANLENQTQFVENLLQAVKLRDTSEIDEEKAFTEEQMNKEEKLHSNHNLDSTDGHNPGSLHKNPNQLSNGKTSCDCNDPTDNPDTIQKTNGNANEKSTKEKSGNCDYSNPNDHHHNDNDNDNDNNNDSNNDKPTETTNTNKRSIKFSGGMMASFFGRSTASLESLLQTGDSPT
eukprot:CAMPEP_0174255084 /NCGR_PEP_ID=MMETSP0439-20130205/4413_1 /TAXON_ID=0 /ORGANISM="Stereomyxa ramosa, Strain Chinc5" /LENGTH=1100 /DNA_ID=CAMNT_0015337079 /DNA_START=20 /DNA_END=3322 /DNA_ORIENTATION=-